MWDEAYASPGELVEVPVGPATHEIVVRCVLPGFSTPERWEVASDVAAISESAAHTWAREGGYAATRVYANVIADLLGGKLEWHSYQEHRSKEQRHEVCWQGPAVEL